MKDNTVRGRSTRNRFAIQYNNNDVDIDEEFDSTDTENSDNTGIDEDEQKRISKYKLQVQLKKPSPVQQPTDRNLCRNIHYNLKKFVRDSDDRYSNEFFSSDYSLKVCRADKDIDKDEQQPLSRYWYIQTCIYLCRYHDYKCN